MANKANWAKIINSTGKHVIEYHKTRIGKICNTKRGGKVNVHFPNLEKIFHLFLIVVFSFYTTLGMVFLICIFCIVILIPLAFSLLCKLLFCQIRLNCLIRKKGLFPIIEIFRNWIFRVIKQIRVEIEAVKLQLNGQVSHNLRTYTMLFARQGMKI